jgi:3'(2'), 5'-bisphosphate nucleotidase
MMDSAQLIELAKKAGEEILKIYQTDFDVETKSDLSPLTAADRAANDVICEGLRKLHPAIPILSEEGKSIDYEDRKNWERFWLVDPLDGTKEFIKRNGDFTVNIALIENGHPVMGIIYIPVSGVLYYNEQHGGAFRVEPDGAVSPIVVNTDTAQGIRLIESLSHPSEGSQRLIDKLTQHYGSVACMNRGSSLKLCAVAEGSAHLYPRMVPTMEWDIAAGHAILEAAGGLLVTLSGEPMQYNKEQLLNPYFYAVSDQSIVEVIR